MYVRWYRFQGHSIPRPPLPMISDCLVYLFDEKKLSVQTIMVYRLMLSFIFKPQLPEISSSHVIKDC